MSHTCFYSSRMSKRKGGYVPGQRRTKKQRGIDNKTAKYIDSAINMRVSGLVGLEKKYHDVVFDDVSLTESLSSTAVTGIRADNGLTHKSMVAIPTGTSFQGREGNEVTLDSFYLKGKVYTELQNPSGVYVPQTARVLVVMDHQNNATGSPSIADVLDVRGATYPTPDFSPVFCYRNLENLDRFTILHDETFDLNSFSAPSINDTVVQTNSATKMINIQIKKPIKGMKVIYSSTSSSDTNQTSNSMYVFMLVDDNAVASTFPACYFRGYARLRWYG